MSNQESTTRRVKVSFNGDIRKTKLPASNCGVDQVRTELERLFGPSAAYGSKIRYSDEDGDMVLICSDDEVEDAFCQAKEQGKTLKLFVENVKVDQKIPPIQKPTGEATEKSSTSPEESGNFSFVSNPNEKKTEQVNKRKLAFEEQRLKDRRHERQKKKEERKKMREESREEHKRGGCRWRGGGHEWRRQWREQRKKAKQDFFEEVKGFLGDKKVIQALQESLPILADKLIKMEEDLKSMIDSVLEVQQVLKEHPFVKKFLPLFYSVIGFIPLKVVGPIMLDVVLDLQRQFQQGKLDIPIHCLIKRVIRMVKRSAKHSAPQVHHGVVCDQCNEGTGPIVGNRWKLDEADYDLCDKHYANLDEESKKMYQKVEQHSWRPPSAFGIPGFRPGPFAFANMFMNMFGGGNGGRGGFGCGRRGGWGGVPCGRGPSHRHNHHNHHQRGAWNQPAHSQGQGGPRSYHQGPQSHWSSAPWMQQQQQNAADGFDKDGNQEDWNEVGKDDGPM
mmetsp:Transcript_14238/g.17068  ORF Transcript_14238/g.17068 Transcript_14238/m.17068 type:complete len:503 (-) Transcript_14238:226-1734(-)|eukprot:jgi/Bigna1/91910/estExt_fgenesh1_pg.C_1290020